MSWQPVPPAPEAPAPKKKIGGWGIAGLIVAGLFIFSAAFPKNDDAVRQTAVAPTEFGAPSDSGVTAEMVVDLTPASTMTAFCDLIEVMPRTAALASFTDGYGYGEDPSASEVFDEMVSRC